MVADGVGHGVGLTGQTGVVAAHDPLKLRKLAHHARGQVRLGQTRRALGLCTVRRTDPYRLVGGRIERRFRRKPVARRLGHGAMMSPAESFDQDAIWASHAGIVWLYGRFLRSGPP